MTQSNRPAGPPDAPAADGDGAGPPPDDDRRAQVSQSVRYRQQARQAEARAGELKAQLDEQRATAQRLQTELAAARRQGELARLLAGRGVVDIDAAVLLAEQRAGGQEPSELLVEQLLKDKPYLLSPASPGEPNAARTIPTQGRRGQRTPLEVLRLAARRAAEAGRGPELEKYMRLRRGRS